MFPFPALGDGRAEEMLSLHQVLRTRSRQGSPAGIRDVPLGISVPHGEKSCAGQGGLREQLFIYSLVFLATQTHKSTYFPKPPNSDCVSNPALLFPSTQEELNAD